MTSAYDDHRQDDDPLQPGDAVASTYVLDVPADGSDPRTEGALATPPADELAPAADATTQRVRLAPTVG